MAGNTAVDANLKKRHTQRQRARIRAMKRRRVIFFSLLFLIAVLIVMFFTPAFQIRSVVIEGNERVSTEQISQAVGEIEGENLFRTSMRRIRKNLLAIAYVDTASVKRVAIPPSVKVTVLECQPAAYIIENEKYIIINEKGKVLEVSDTIPEGIPQLAGFSPTVFEPGQELEIDEQNKYETVLLCITEMQKAGILSGVRLVSFEDVSNITFNYEDRLDVLCGSEVEFSKKMSLFREAIHSSKLTENSRGTIDLSVTGKAVYTP